MSSIYCTLNILNNEKLEDVPIFNLFYQEDGRGLLYLYKLYELVVTSMSKLGIVHRSSDPDQVHALNRY